jgi:phosphoglycerate dehydrogenase-like enzyme
MLILIADAFDASLPAKLARFGEVTEDPARLPEAEVVLIRSKSKCTAEWFAGAPKVKLVIRGGVGMDNIDREYAKAHGIKAVNTPKASSIAVAELAFAMMLAVPNRLVEAHNSTAAGQFLKKELKRTELFGKTLGLIGIGNIAREVAKRATAFGMKVNYYDPFVPSSDVATVKPTLEALVADADYISMHTPFTPETDGMINAAVIAKMKKGVVIVNTGRGKCVNAADLVAALTSGQVGTYATDVWPSDPPSADYPILKAPNVLMAPHLGASTKENLGRIGEEVQTILADYVNGGK